MRPFSIKYHPIIIIIIIICRRQNLTLCEAVAATAVCGPSDLPSSINWPTNFWHRNQILFQYISTRRFSAFVLLSPSKRIVRIVGEVTLLLVLLRSALSPFPPSLTLRITRILHIQDDFGAIKHSS